MQTGIAYFITVHLHHNMLELYLCGLLSLKDVFFVLFSKNSFLEKALYTEQRKEKVKILL